MLPTALHARISSGEPRRRASRRLLLDWETDPVRARSAERPGEVAQTGLFGPSTWLTRWVSTADPNTVIKTAPMKVALSLIWLRNDAVIASE